MIKIWEGGPCETTGVWRRRKRATLNQEVGGARCTGATGGVSGRGALGVLGPPTVSLLRSGGCLSRW